jgi:low temperature requirement protein LtrA
VSEPPAELVELPERRHHLKKDKPLPTTQRMDALLFLLGLVMIGNFFYGFALWVRAMKPGGRRTFNIVAAVIMSIGVFPLAAGIMLGYTPWRLWKNAQAA